MAESDPVYDLPAIDIRSSACTHLLKQGDPQQLRQTDPIVVIGFPNYRVGDTGTVRKGEVNGFRIISTIRRILVDAAIVTGNSGGPVLDRNLQVVGVAVTGVEKIEEANTTEKHGVIPIDAIKPILKSVIT